MRLRTVKHLRGVIAIALAVSGLALIGSSATAAPVAIDLCASDGTAPLPGGGTVPIWGFGIPSTPGDCSTATPSLPGPVLTVNEGDDVTINLTNDLPDEHTLQWEIPGLRMEPGPTDVAVGSTVSITFAASRPGTFLYESGGDSGRQEAMGLSGALRILPATAGQAYGSADSAFDVEAVLVLSAIDPDFNAAPDTFDLLDYQPEFWTINGQSFPDTAPGITAAPGQRVLLRYLNAGFDNTTMELLGVHEHVIAQDAHHVPVPYDAVAETIPAGGTEDTIVTMPSYGAPSANGFALFNRQLHVTNGVQGGTSPAPAGGGGMLIFLHS
jgi:FtsP/CotA-like multicopper oxidase with cupredoxin domain